jgi:hypothetical protein
LAQPSPAQPRPGQPSPAQPRPAQPSPAQPSKYESYESYVLCALAFMCVRVMSHYASSPEDLVAPNMPRPITIRDVLSYNLCGKWSDDRGNNYTVTIDEDGRSCTVRTVRRNGRVIETPGLIRGRLHRLTWGLNYVLRTQLPGDHQPPELLWQPTRPAPHRPNIKWRRCDTTGLFFFIIMSLMS